MSANLFIAVLLASVAVFAAAEPMVNLNFDSYQGTWYLVQFANNDNNNGTSNSSLPCLKESYARKADNPFIAEMMWSGGSDMDGTKQELSGIATFADEMGAGPWHIYLDGARLETHIVSTDYTNWAIEYAFGSYNASKFERVMIRSRTTSLDATVLATLHSFISSMGLDFGFHDVDHSVC